MKIKVLLFGSGIAVAIVGAVIFVSNKSEDVTAIQTESGLEESSPFDDNNLDAALAEIKKLKAKITELNMQLAMKQNEASDLGIQLSEYQSGEVGRQAERSNRREEVMSKMREWNDGRTQSRATLLSSAIGMDDEQTALLHAFMLRRNELEGEEREEMKMSDYLAEILNEDQYAEYQLYLSEQNTAQLEMASTRELGKMVALRLSDEQKDIVYEIIYNRELTTFAEGERYEGGRGGKGGRGTRGDEGDAGNSPELVDLKISEMAGVFDDTQLAAYRVQLESDQGGGGFKGGGFKGAGKKGGGKKK